MNPDKTSRQRKWFVGVLVLAIGGLAVDRLVLGGATGPNEAGADTLAPALTTSAGLAQAIQPSPGLATRANTLAGRLDRTARQERYELLNIDDAFRASPLWIKPPARTAEQKAKEPVTDAEAFTAKHKLMAVITNNAGGAAIIGSQTVLVGRVIDGFTLVAVTKRTAVLEKGGHRVELALPEPATGNAKVGD